MDDAIDLDGYVDARGVRYVGKAMRQPDGKYIGLADVDGCLCRVELVLTAVPVATVEGGAVESPVLAPARACVNLECLLYRRIVRDEECAVCGGRTAPVNRPESG